MAGLMATVTPKDPEGPGKRGRVPLRRQGRRGMRNVSRIGWQRQGSARAPPRLPLAAACASTLSAAPAKDRQPTDHSSTLPSPPAKGGKCNQSNNFY